MSSRNSSHPCDECGRLDYHTIFCPMWDMANDEYRRLALYELKRKKPKETPLVVPSVALTVTDASDE